MGGVVCSLVHGGGEFFEGFGGDCAQEVFFVFEVPVGGGAGEACGGAYCAESDGFGATDF